MGIKLVCSCVELGDSVLLKSLDIVPVCAAKQVMALAPAFMIKPQF